MTFTCVACNESFDIYSVYVRHRVQCDKMVALRKRAQEVEERMRNEAEMRRGRP